MRLIVWLPESTAARLDRRRGELGRTRSEYLRNLVDNALARVPSTERGER